MVNLHDYMNMPASQQKKVSREDLQKIVEGLARNSGSGGGGPSNGDIMRELKSMRKDIDELHTELNAAYDMIDNQMRFMEIIDAKERGKNLIITGLKEMIDENLEKQVSDVIFATDYGNEKVFWNDGDDGNEAGLFVDNEMVIVKRLGKPSASPNPDRPRAVLVQLPSKKIRDDLIDCAKALKDKEQYSKTFLKRDVHPAFRKEQGRFSGGRKY